MPTHPQHGSLGCNQGSHSLVHHDLLTLTRFLCPPSLHFVHPFPAHILTAPCYLSPPQPRHRSSLTITPSSAPLPTLLRPSHALPSLLPSLYHPLSAVSPSFFLPRSSAFYAQEFRGLVPGEFSRERSKGGLGGHGCGPWIQDGMSGAWISGVSAGAEV